MPEMMGWHSPCGGNGIHAGGWGSHEPLIPVAVGVVTRPSREGSSPSKVSTHQARRVITCAHHASVVEWQTRQVQDLLPLGV